MAVVEYGRITERVDKNMSKKRARRNIKKKKKSIKYFEKIIKKRYKETLDINEKGIPVLKNTDFPVSAYLQYSLFLGYSDEYLTRTFHLEMKENQLADIKRDAFLFSINVLEHSFEKEMRRYDDWLYKEEMSGCW